MKYEILNYYFHTPFGSDPWDNLSGTRAETMPRPTLLELLDEFIEKQSQGYQLVCSAKIAEKLAKLEFENTLPFSSEIMPLSRLITHKPIWFLANSESDNTLIGSLIKRSDCGFSLSDALSLMSEDWKSSTKPRIDLHSLPFSREQVWVLSLILAQELQDLEIF